MVELKDQGGNAITQANCNEWQGGKDPIEQLYVVLVIAIKDFGNFED